MSTHLRLENISLRVLISESGQRLAWHPWLFPASESDEMLQRIDDEAAIGLSNIKRIVEARWGNAD